MTETPESRDELGKAKADALIDRVKAWRAEYDAVKAEREGVGKAKRKATLAEIRALQADFCDGK
jgi:hypothetical protein